MKNNKYLLNTILAVILFVILFGLKLYKVFVPAAILPGIDIPGIALVSLIAITTDHYISGKTKHRYLAVFVLSALAYGALPFAAGFIGICTSVKLAFAGAVVFTIITIVYDSIICRITADGAKKAAPIVSAIGIYLALQCFSSII